MPPALDLIVKNVRVIRPHQPDIARADIGIAGGRIARVTPDIPAVDAREVYDGRGMLAFPGVVDAHTHVGIYGPLADDALTESKAAVSGGVTTMLTYFRSGQYYLNRGGPYAEFYPEVLRLSRDRYWCDYGYHLAPVHGSHVGEMELLAREHGVSSFKIFMFYGGAGLHGQSDPGGQRRFLMLNDGEAYDFAHFEWILREAGRLRREADANVSVSLHCEVADIVNAYASRVARAGALTGLPAYHAARPPHAEGLAVWIAAYLAHEAGASVNLLHLSSRKALEAALAAARIFDDVDFRREITVGHLLLDIDSPAGPLAKVNPPIRPREDVEYLWARVLDGGVDWIVSDHACCAREQKVAAERPDDIWLAKSGFGGTEYLLSGVVSEGTKRGLSLPRIAELTSWNPAQRFGLPTKGDIAAGYDADLALLDPDRSFTVRGADSPSGQGYTPFEGLTLRGQVRATFLRGRLVFENGTVHGPARGRYLKR
jgi:allantoinase